jgi:hypothetical protein
MRISLKKSVSILPVFACFLFFASQIQALQEPSQKQGIIHSQGNKSSFDVFKSPFIPLFQRGKLNSPFEKGGKGGFSSDSKNVTQIKVENEPSQKQKSVYDINTKVSVGYDYNVSDRVKDAIKSRFLQCYLTSGIDVFPTKKTLLSIKIQDGLKFFDAPKLAHESIFINNINAYVSNIFMGFFIPEFTGEIRTRTSIHSKNNVSPSEESYLRGLVGLSMKTLISVDFSAKPFYNYRATNFEDFDPYDRQTHEFGIRTDVKLLPNSTMNLQYQREIIRYNKWDEGKLTRKDTADVLTAGIQMYKNLLLNASLSYENNRSDIDKYSYKDYIISIILAKAIYQNTVLEIFTFLRSRNGVFLDDAQTPAQIDMEDEEKGTVTLKISRDITEKFALEAEYELRRNKPIDGENVYIKNVVLVSVSYKF